MEILLFLLTIPLINWILKPITEKYAPEKMTLKKPPLNIPTKLNFRPTIFQEYIGQKKAKVLFRRYIQATQERNFIFPHTLIYGKAGMGKTTLAKILAKELEVKVVETITSEIVDVEQIINLINEAEGGIVFLDEIHSINRDNAEKIYTIMEDFQFKGKYITPFTLIGATTELGEMIKNRKPFVDRFKILIELEDYNYIDLKVMAKQYQETVFPDDIIEEDVVKIITYNCRGTPRLLIRLLEATIYFNQNIRGVLESFNIIKNGYTNKDLEILKYLTLNEKGVGLQGLAAYLDTSQANYLFEIEPYLLKNKLILRTARGRKITNQGIELIEELEEVNNN